MQVFRPVKTFQVYKRMKNLHTIIKGSKHKHPGDNRPIIWNQESLHTTKFRTCKNMPWQWREISCHSWILTSKTDQEINICKVFHCLKLHRTLSWQTDLNVVHKISKMLLRHNCNYLSKGSNCFRRMKISKSLALIPKSTPIKIGPHKTNPDIQTIS